MTDGISIKADREYLREAFAKVNSGEYAIPVFQRDFIWNKKQIISLFDSIQKGYPIGSIILWKSNEIRYAKDILTDVKHEQTGMATFYILDGRQRLTSFYGCVTENRSQNPKFDLYYNLETREFCYPPIKDVRYPLLKVSDVYDTYSLLESMRDIMNTLDENVAKNYIEAAKNLNAKLQSYTVGEVKMENCTLREAREVFSRVNSKGTDISDLDMIQAMSYGGDGQELLKERIDKMLQSLTAYGFSTLPAEWVFNCLYIFVNKDKKMYYDASVSDLEHLNVEQIFPRLDQALKEAVGFLHDSCYVYHQKLMPYRPQLAALVRFFSEVSNPSPVQLAYLKQWFFYTTFNNLLSGSFTKVREIMGDIDLIIKGEAPIRCARKFEYKDGFEKKLMTRSARFKFMLLAQIRQYVRCFSSDENSYIDYVNIAQNQTSAYVVRFSNERDLFVRRRNGIIYPIDEETCRAHLLDSRIIAKLQRGDTYAALSERKTLLRECELELLEEANLNVAISSHV
jgi:hypothetical protein